MKGIIMTMHKTMRPGFSFLELMVALTIIGIIAGFIGPRLFKALGTGYKTKTENVLKVVKQAVKEYKMHVGKYPSKLEDLVVKPEGASGWDGPYVGDEDSANPEVPKDGWGQDIMYKLNAPGTKPPFELYSEGDPEKEDNRIDAK
ncbi:MAG: type II secretion system protein GspG [Epsilonproteobacteria bacterium]|nr:type II secretion system protein GspG [Campylobacterota bacterium]|tara:strand:+ start:7772 stop:8206 length:435 start_codon:yes stop_codon:yes gene_type:complete